MANPILEQLAASMQQTVSEAPTFTPGQDQLPKTMQELAQSLQSIMPQQSTMSRKPDMLTEVAPAALASMAGAGYGTPFSGAVSNIGRAAQGFAQGFNLMKQAGQNQQPYTMEDVKMASEIVKNLRENAPAGKMPSLPNPFYMAIGLSALKTQNPAMYRQLTQYYSGIAGADATSQKEIDAYAKAQAGGKPQLFLAIEEMLGNPNYTISKETAAKLQREGSSQDFIIIRKDLLGNQ